MAKLEERNSTLETEVEEWKEQVDLALGAEEMVEQLTTRTLDLEEKLKEEMERANDLGKFIKASCSLSIRQSLLAPARF